VLKKAPSAGFHFGAGFGFAVAVAVAEDVVSACVGTASRLASRTATMSIRTRFKLGCPS
jgi:hypothetical protein